MRLLLIAAGLIGLLLPSLANAQMVDDPFSDYLQRSQGISTGVGNANATNEAIQTITPWPPRVGDRRIHLQGRQAVDAIERMYRVPDPFERQGAGAPGGTPSGASAGASPTGSPVTAMQPVSGN